MSTTDNTTESGHGLPGAENPGARLAIVREQKGITRDYVAAKLHLKLSVIEALERDDYSKLPETVFIRGYIGAYAKLLDLTPAPYLAMFNAQCVDVHVSEKALWQNRREVNRSETFVRLVTALVAITAIVAVYYWWGQNKETQTTTPVAPAVVMTTHEVKPTPAKDHSISETALATMQSLFADTKAQEIDRA